MSTINRILATELTPKRPKWKNLTIGDFVGVKDTIGRRIDPSTSGVDGVTRRIPPKRYRIVDIWYHSDVFAIDYGSDRWVLRRKDLK